MSNYFVLWDVVGVGVGVYSGASGDVVYSLLRKERAVRLSATKLRAYTGYEVTME